jgi:hypothetical protein
MMVAARLVEAMSSHRNGRRANATGVVRCTVMPAASGCSAAPIRPRSWNSGSQVAIDSPSADSRAPANAYVLWTRLAWLTITPLGSRVEPDVYCSRARSDGRATIRSTESTVVGSCSTAIRCGAGPAAGSNWAVTNPATAAGAMTTDGAQSRTMPRSRSPKASAERPVIEVGG